jgi:hypothetical protein
MFLGNQWIVNTALTSEADGARRGEPVGSLPTINAILTIIFVPVAYHPLPC